MNKGDVAKVNRLRNAVFEANRFIGKASKAADLIESGDGLSHHNPELAAAKRASLDLTKSLSALRRSPYQE